MHIKSHLVAWHYIRPVVKSTFQPYFCYIRYEQACPVLFSPSEKCSMITSVLTFKDAEIVLCFYLSLNRLACLSFSHAGLMMIRQDCARLWLGMDDCKYYCFTVIVGSVLDIQCWHSLFQSKSNFTVNMQRNSDRDEDIQTSSFPRNPTEIPKVKLASASETRKSLLSEANSL